MTWTMKKMSSPDGGCGNLCPYLWVASLNTPISWTDPGYPARTKVNLMSKSQMANTFWVVYPCWPVCWTTLDTGTTIGTYVPSIAPIQLSKKGWNRAPCNLGWTVLNFGSLGLITSAKSLYTLYNTSSNFLLTVSSDLSKRLSTCLTDWGAPIIHKNMHKASIDDILANDFKPYDVTSKSCNL